MKKKILLTLLMLVGIVYAKAQSIENDKVVNAMKEEMDYNLKELAKQQIPAYFLSLRLVCNKNIGVESNMGKSVSFESSNSGITPQVRVGSMDVDNFKYKNQGTQSQRRDEGAHSVPVTQGNLMPYRLAIWRETISRYRIAVRNYHEALSKMQTNVDNEDKAPCFSKAPVEQYYEKPLTPAETSLDTAAWRVRLDKVTSVFAEYPELENGSAVINSGYERKYIVNSEGSVVVQNRRVIQLSIMTSAIADDGYECPMQKSYFAFDESQLPSTDSLVAAARDIVERIFKLRAAPVADPYTGPAILSGDASGVLFHEIFGHRLESHRMKTGGQTFKKMIGQSVLPADFNVYSDPTLKYYGNDGLNGYYLYDDEGTKARRVTNVKNGKLTEFLMGRLPIEGFPSSNGHARASGGTDPVSRQSNLIIETSKPYTDAQLRQMLKDEAKKQGKEYGYYFRSATSGLTFTGEGNTINSFNVDPVEVYRIYVDGRPDELVRGVTLIGTPLSVFSNVTAGGETPKVFFGSCGAESGWIPVTAIAPSVFVSKIETQRNSITRPLPRVLPKPELRNTNHTNGKDDCIMTAMKDEMARTIEGLKTESQDKPCFVDYYMEKYRYFYVQATLGEIERTTHTPFIIQGKANVLLGDKNRTSAINDNMQSFLITTGDDYNAIRKELWKTTDSRFKSAINEMTNKLNRLKQSPLPEEDVDVPDMIELPAIEHIANTGHTHAIDTTWCKTATKELSAVLCDYPELYNTSCNATWRIADSYHVTSEGQVVRLPNEWGELNVIANIKAVDGTTKNGTWTYAVRSKDAYPSLDELKAEVRAFADNLRAQGSAEAVKEYYVGPLMIEEEAVSETFMRSVITPFASASRSTTAGSGTNSMLVGKRLIDTKLNIYQLSDIPSYHGTNLVGNYTIDINGVKPASRMPLVENGLLKNLMCGRKPAVGALTTTGNDALGMYLNDFVYPGIFSVTSEKTVPMSKMKSRLLSEAKKAGLDHAYIVKAPKHRWRYLVRVDVATGKEEIVRARNILQPSKSDLMHVSAVSKEEFVSNQIDNGNRLFSGIVPKAIIIESVEYKIERPVREQKDELVHPALR